MRTYTVLVGNVGQVHCGHNKAVAAKKYRGYVKESKAGAGRVGNEPVVLLFDDDTADIHGILREHHPPGKGEE